MNTLTTAEASTAQPSTNHSSPVSNKTRYLRERREALRKKLGGKCVRCGATENLQFDCIISAGPEHHGMSWRGRLKFYEGENERENVQLLCPSCHVTKTLDEIAARKFHDFRARCPSCQKSFRVGDQMRVAEPDYDAPEGKPAVELEARPEVAVRLT